MKIGFDAKRAFYNRSGLGNYSRNNLILLKKYYPQHEYLLYTPSIENSIFNCNENNFRIRQPNTPWDKYFSAYWRTINLKKYLEKDKINIFHGLSNELPLQIQQSKIKSIVTIHDLIFLRFPLFFSWIDNRIYKRKFKHACMASDRLIAVSKQTKNDIISFFNVDPNKISVVYQGCDASFWKKVNKSIKNKIKKKYQLHKPFLLNVGTIEPRKNARNLIYALLYTKAEINVVFIGKPTRYCDTLKKILKNKKLENRVFFFHNILTEDLPAIYQLASGFVYPSYFEGFGIPILEALVSGIPVISSYSSCLSETGGKAALYFNPNSPEEIAYCIDRILNDTKLRKDMIEKGHTHAQQFSDEHVATNLMKVYKKLVCE